MPRPIPLIYSRSGVYANTGSAIILEQGLIPLSIRAFNLNHKAGCSDSFSRACATNISGYAGYAPPCLDSFFEIRSSQDMLQWLHYACWVRAFSMREDAEEGR